MVYITILPSNSHNIPVNSGGHIQLKFDVPCTNSHTPATHGL